MERTTEIKYIFWIGTLVMLFLALLVILLAVFYQKNIQKIKKRETQLLLNASLEVEKKERKKIASDLHDGIAGDLVAIRNFVVVLNKKELSPGNKAILEEIEIGIDYTLKDIKAISQSLMPSHLETLGLVETFKYYLDHLNKLPSINTNIQLPTEEMIINTSVAYEIFRIFQELISNILQHNIASEIEIGFESDLKNVFIYISDNGRPFQLKSNFDSIKGKGITNIFSRVQHINGEIEQQNIIKGNKIKLSIPKEKCLELL